MSALDPDQRFMRQALRLAARGRGWTGPNPMVGAVVVAGGEVVGEGHHRGPGGAHGEIVALERAGDGARGATLYLTLEPCVHHGRTPPCAPRVIAAGVARAVIASEDPNPRVAGRGITALRQAGIEVAAGLLREHENRLNEAYRKHITTGRPFVTLKIATSLDGKIATRTGDSRCITGQPARTMTHRLRRDSDAILVGVQTLIADDPELTVRHVRLRREPLRVVCDSSARTPPQARLLSSGKRPPLIAVTDRARAQEVRALGDAGAQVLVLPQWYGRVHLGALLEELGRREVASLLVEGGGEISASFVEQRLADKLVLFVAPKIIGGAEARTAVGGAGVAAVEGAWQVRDMRYRRLGDDFMIEGYLG
jgi:diaminohydroxyphosphoribosylaminopyrimidine deaminase/5-amino-6-(5-phosphoribosylamino)uracil reductase